MTIYYCSRTVARMGLTAPEHSAGQLSLLVWSWRGSSVPSHCVFSSWWWQRCKRAVKASEVSYAMTLLPCCHFFHVTVVWGKSHDKVQSVRAGDAPAHGEAKAGVQSAHRLGWPSLSTLLAEPFLLSVLSCLVQWREHSSGLSSGFKCCPFRSSKMCRSLICEIDSVSSTSVSSSGCRNEAPWTG